MPSQEEIQQAKELFDKLKPFKTLDDITKTNIGLHAVLSYLFATDEETTSKDISTALNVSSARMTVLLKKLESAQLIEKSPSPTDARAVHIKLTEKGVLEAYHIESQKELAIATILETIPLNELTPVLEKMKFIHTTIQNTMEKNNPKSNPTPEINTQSKEEPPC